MSAWVGGAKIVVREVGEKGGDTELGEKKEVGVDPEVATAVEEENEGMTAKGNDEEDNCRCWLSSFCAVASSFTTKLGEIEEETEGEEVTCSTITELKASELEVT